MKTFREELVEMLNKAGIEYDPKYLTEATATPAGVGIVRFHIRGWRSCLAQPPANGWHPSGMGSRVDEHLKKMGAKRK